MKLLEEYQELIVRDAMEISCLWKYVQIFLYLLGAISGYASSVLFYTLWKQIFGGNCPLWAKVVLLREELELENIDDVCNSLDWWKYIFIDYQHDNICRVYLIMCFSSCTFGIVWFILFFICGKGGHDDASIYPDPWRIVFPAMYFNFAFITISMYTDYNFQQGYKAFSKNMRNITSEMYNICKKVADVSDCEIIKICMKIHHFYMRDLDYLCNIISYLQVPLVLMMCSWAGGLVVLLFRIITSNDFRILKIRIYEVKDE
ncbi:hypothetical protein QLX08_010911 [Tetragonisca angustula]|uniref:Uncharacterized protein n=1 Tax=Tetragonisca angustula TaxID=166442 RepID=A0AAW0ZAA3_9HYME